MKSHITLCALICAFSALNLVQGANVVVPPKERFTLGAANWGVNGENSTVTLKVSKLTFNHSGITGGLKLMLFATTQPYQLGARGFAIAELKLGQLKSNQFYTDINRVVPLVRPPAGTYYLTIMVMEYKSTKNYVRELHARGSNTFTFR